MGELISIHIRTQQVRSITLSLMTSTSFRVSLYGRFGYAVMAIFGSILSLLLVLALSQYQILPLWALAFFGLFFIAGAGIAGYSLSQLFRLTPRFVLSERGFAYRGFVSRFECRWSDIASFRLRYAGGAPLIFLEVVFSNRHRRFCKRVSLDVSGLRPDHRELMGSFQRHVSAPLGNPSPWWI